MKNLLTILLFIPVFTRAQTTTLSTKPLIAVGWESGTRTQGIFGTSSLCQPPYDAVISTDFARSGTKSIRFQINDTDANCTGHMRTELSARFMQLMGYNNTISWSELIPTNMAYDIIPEVHFQMHDSGALGSPLWGIEVYKDRYYFGMTIYREDLRWYGSSYAAATPTERKDSIIQKKYDLGPVTKGVWVDWVVIQKLRLDGTGNLKVYKNGVLATGQLQLSGGGLAAGAPMDINGTNLNRLADGRKDGIPYPKFGIYKWQWTPKAGFPTGTPHTVTSKVVYIDDVKFGDSTVPLSEFIYKSLQATISKTNITCYGAANGTATVTPTFGYPPYTYRWNTLATTATISSLAPGTYTALVTDSKFNTATVSTTITQPAAPLAMNVTYGVIYSGGATTTSVVVTATGGTLPYSGTGTFTRNVGTFIFPVTDANGCAIADTITIPLTPAPVLTIDLDSTDALCYNGTTGAATSSVTGNSGAITYSWTGPNGFTASTQNISGVRSGIYILTATDAASASGTASITINQPTQLVASNIPGTVTVVGDSTTVLISASGGTSPYSGTGTFYQVVGIKTYTVTDAHGCTAQTIATVPYVPVIPEVPVEQKPNKPVRIRIKPIIQN